MTAFGSPASASDGNGGVTIEEFVCYRSVGDTIMLGRGIAITMPGGRTFIVCLSGQP